LPVVLRDDHEGSPLRIQKPDRFPATLGKSKCLYRYRLHGWFWSRFSKDL